MSNHDGSRMVKALLEVLERARVFERLNPDETLAVVQAFVRIGNGYDCNPGEILEDIGIRLGICYYCLQRGTITEEGLCVPCDEKFTWKPAHNR